MLRQARLPRLGLTLAVGSRRNTKAGPASRRPTRSVPSMTSGLRNKEIAANCIREKTVKSYLNNIFLKLGLEGRFALSVFDQGHARLKT
jgi:DNA-binding NarL/FixJ family response regulator